MNMEIPCEILNEERAEFIYNTYYSNISTLSNSFFGFVWKVFFMSP